MNQSINRIWILTKRNFKEIMRDPLSLVFIIALPLVMEILFYILFSKLTPQYEMKFLSPGIVVFSQTFLSLFIGLLISLDKSTSFLTRLYVSKAKSYEFVISYALALIPIVLLQSSLFFIIGGLFENSVFKIEMIYSIILSLITSLLFLSFGILIGSLCNEKSVGGVASIIISGHSVLSGMWFPMEGINETMIKIMNVLPFKNATMLVSKPLSGISNVSDDFIVPFIIVLTYIVIVFILSIIIYKKKMTSK